MSKPLLKKVDYDLIRKEKIVDIHDISFKSKSELTSLLSKLIKRYPNYSICYPTFHNQEKEYKLITDVLEKLNFKLIYSKPIFEKKIKNIKLNDVLSFRDVATNSDKKICLNMYKSALKNTRFPADYLDSLSPIFYFNNYILNKNKRLNFLVIYQNKIAGFVTIHIKPKRKFGYIGFIAILKKYRGKHFSYEVLNKVETELYRYSVKRWLGSTDQFNKIMIKTFNRYGFKRVKHLCGYVYRPEIAFKKFIAHSKS